MFRIVVGLYLMWVAALGLSVGCHSFKKSKTASLRPAPIKIEPAPMLARANGSDRVDKQIETASAIDSPRSPGPDPSIESIASNAPAAPPDLSSPKPLVAEGIPLPEKLGPDRPAPPEPVVAEEMATPPESPRGPAPLSVGPAASLSAETARQDPSDLPKSVESVSNGSPAPIREPSAQKESNTGTIDPLEQVRQICQRGEDFNNSHPDFVCRMTRSERIQGSIRSPELMLMKLRSTPRSVHLKWLDSPNEGRECIYIEGQNNGKMISRGGKGDLLLAGRTLWLDPEGGLAKSKSSQTITETGLDVICNKIRRRLDKLGRGDNSEGTLTASRGPDPFIPVLTYDWIEHQCPPRVDTDLKSGGTHQYGFRSDTGQLEVVHAFNNRQELMYTYRFERLIPVTRWEATDFNVEALNRNRRASDPDPAEDRVVQKDGVSPQ
jgi:hypothetical protein